MKLLLLKTAFLVFAIAPATALFAQEAEAAPEVHSPADFVWIMVAAFLVFFMQAGFALVETGLTRAKNAGNIIMKNLMDFAFGSLIFFVIGYGLMFGASKAGLIGTSNFLLSDAAPVIKANGDNAGMWAYAFWLFQAVFAATAATIVSGAMAERTKFTSYLIYTVFISAVIYPVSGHWIWGPGGWLAGLGFKDFAGSTVVHSVGGWAALMGAILLGPRLGKYGPDGKPKAIPGHNIPLAALGVFILWFGWFGFNPGSTTAATPSIGFIAVNTNLAAAAGAVAAMITIWIKSGKPDVSMSLNGALGGLVAITAGCAYVSPTSSMLIGLMAGVLVVLSVELFDFVFKIDDPVGAISVHGVTGAFGTLMVGIFAQEAYAGKGVNGLFYGGGFSLLGTQALGVISVLAWVVLTSGLLFFLIKKIVGLRVSRDEELRGLDIDEHGMEAYSGFQIFRNQ
ncbi:MAG: ammonium transporter [Spirochaetes bacterium]|nr:ammonium transporter [Spirochaetota bacterium]